jgi:hypothetical protein
MNEVGIGLGDQLNESSGVVGEFSGDMEPFVLGFHEMAIEGVNDGPIVLL